MRFAEIYRRLATGEMVVENIFGNMAAIEKLAQIEGVTIDSLDLTAPEFALRYQRLSPPVSIGVNATSYGRWRRTLLDLQMLALPGDTDGDAWASLRRAARLSGAVQVANGLYQLSSRLPDDIQPVDVTDDVLRDVALRTDINAQPFRQGVRAFGRLFETPLAVATGLLPRDALTGC